GLEKRSRRINPKEKKIVAYHESGHALMAETTKGARHVSKVSIIPRGLAALGYTLNTPEENKYMMQRHELVAEVDVLLSGRAAEEIFIGEISTGAGNDLERATDIIKSMVSVYGMSDVAGLMVLEKQRNTFIAPGYGNSREYSDKMAEDVDNYVKNLLQERYEAVKEHLKNYKGAIETMVESLYEHENIEGELVRKIIAEYEEEMNMESRLQPMGGHDDDIKSAKDARKAKKATKTEEKSVEKDGESKKNSNNIDEENSK
ncbi:MAG: cell division protein FtsH, partial [Campylobacteraceae bacterium]|nr:cell division protein FtsH [Campylobacteraceae bacterium]